MLSKNHSFLSEMKPAYPQQRLSCSIDKAAKVTEWAVQGAIFPLPNFPGVVLRLPLVCISEGSG